MEIREKVSALYEDVVENRRHLHKYPEIGFDTPNTEAYIVKKLQEYGFEIIDRGWAKHGVVACLKVNEQPGIGFRSDMDALPIQEENEIAFGSTNEYAHMCGHDGHMSALLGLAKYLAMQKEQLKKTVYFIFQPAEEGPGGAEVMIEEGLFETYPMECIFGTHVMGEVAEGVIASRAGPMMARNGELRIAITGKSTHGATPQLGSDAIVAGAAFVTSLQNIMARNISPLDSGVVTIGSFHGGTAENIIAETVAMEGTIRAFKDEVYDTIKQRITAIAEGISQAYGVCIDAQIIDYYRVVNNDARLYQALQQACAGEVFEVEPKMAAEDFSFYQQKVPGLFYLIGTHSDTFDQHLHNSKFNFDEKVLLKVIETNLRLLETLGAYHD